VRATGDRSGPLIDDLIELLQVLRRLSHPVRRGEITPEQHWLLRQLARRGPESIGEIAQRLGVSPSAATIACQRLERQGLVARRRSPADERVVLVDLTDDGRAAIARWDARKREVLAAVLAALGDEEQEAFRPLLERLLRRAEEIARESVGEPPRGGPTPRPEFRR
jgi:DNA-binding MarR family transcriptional regulator